MIDLFFDFDGVLVDSNEIKIVAFLEVAKRHFQEEIGSSLEDKIRTNLFTTRFQIFDYLLREFVPITTYCSRELLLDEFESTVRQKLLKTERLGKDSLARFTDEFRPWILSAAPTQTLKELIENFGWRDIFQERVLGSPTSKIEHLQALAAVDYKKSYFLGDARSDFEVADRMGLRFVFISGWSSWVPTLDERDRMFKSFQTTEQALKFLFDSQLEQLR